MDDRLAFLRAIRANPDDDTARLAFADWLDEHDDPLGAFVRVQIELEPIRYRIDDPRARELHRREDELLRQHGDDWAPTNGLLAAADCGPVFRRGLPERACLSLDTFLTNGEAFFAAHPTLREIALYGVANRCAELARCPLLARLDALEIADWPTADDAAALGTSAHLPHISRFKLWVGGEPHLLRALAGRSDPIWPRALELVQLHGGAACRNAETAIELNARADELVRRADAWLGRREVRVTRPFEQLFPLDGEVGKNICAGRLPDGRPAVAAGNFEGWVLVTFTDDGHVRDVTARDAPVRKPGARYGDSEAEFKLGTAFVEWVDEDLRLELGPIWVREFDVEELEVGLFSYRLRTRVEHTGPVPPPMSGSASDWRDLCGHIWGWLENRNFVVGWSAQSWADWRGKIHSPWP